MELQKHEKQVKSIIERARSESFNDNELVIYDDFLSETGVKNPAEMTSVDVDAFLKYLYSSNASNEFVANVVNRLAQVAPAEIVNLVLLSDRGGDGVLLYQELRLGTRATEFDTPAEIAAARQQQYQFSPTHNNDMDL
ncbi:hypothetical protein NUACC21_35820 [Scytonema sp. NUACC21]